MTKLKHRLIDDLVFKLLFSKHPDLLKRLVSELLKIPYESIWQFEITNPEIPPEIVGSKFCRLDINMIVNRQHVDLEVQDQDNGGCFVERSLFYWAREYSISLPKGEKYGELPGTIVISILNFNQFDCEEYFSEYHPLEITRHTKLTDKMRLLYYELSKLRGEINPDNMSELWLWLFKVGTEEALTKINNLEVSLMQEVIDAFRTVTVSPEFQELERLRSKARHDEAQALYHAQQEERKKWQSVIAEKDSMILEKEAELADKDSVILEKEVELADKDSVISEKDALIAELKKRLGEDK